MNEITRPVLVVEDDPDTVEVLKRLFGRVGVEAVYASTTAEAREAIERSRPSGIVLEQMMPDGTGLEFFRALRADPALREIPTYFYSAAFAWREQWEAEQLGAKAWFVKGASRPGDPVDHVAAECGGPS